MPPAYVVEISSRKRRVHRRFVDAGLLDVAADAIELRAAVLLGTKLREPLRRRSATMSGTLQSVSTLFTAVGHW